MDIIILIIGLLLIFMGVAGAVLPVIPGLPMSYVGILLLHFTGSVVFTTQFLIFWAVVIVLVELLDFFIPIWGTKKFGGSKRGVWGCAIGMFVGLFFAPWGIIVGPFAGAVLGEMSKGKETRQAIKAGFGSFLGFIVGIVSKLIVGGFLIFHTLSKLI